MTTIRLFRHPLSGAFEEFEAESVGAWLLAHYGRHAPPAMRVYAGVPSEASDLTGDAAALARSEAAFYSVLETPGLPAGLVGILQSLAISTAISLVARHMAGFGKNKPLANRTQESPNNALGSRDNRVRLLERVEDIFGEVRAVPSLMMPSYIKYLDNAKVEYAYLCVGRGYYQVQDLREGDTALADIDGASAEVFPPFTSPNSGDPPQLSVGAAIIDQVQSVERSSAVNGIVLKAANQLQLKAPNLYYFYGPSGVSDGLVPPHSSDVIYQREDTRQPNFAAVAQNGQTISILVPDISHSRVLPVGGLMSVDGPTRTYTSNIGNFFNSLVNGSTITWNGFGGDADGPKTVESHTHDTVTVQEALTTQAGTPTVRAVMQLNYGGTRTIDTVEDGWVQLNGEPQFTNREWLDPDETPGSFYEEVTGTIVVDNGLTDWTDWFTLPQDERTEVWTNVLALQGMFKDDGSKHSATTTYEVQIERLNPDLTPQGTVETMIGSLTGSTSAERAETLERVTGWVGPARVRARRTSSYDYEFEGFVQDEITWADLYAVLPVDKTHFGNKTTIHAVTRATSASTAVTNRQLTCLAARKLPMYDGSSDTFTGAFDADGRHVSGTIHPTRRMVDILAAIVVDPRIGARDRSDIDLAQVLAVQQTLDAWHPEAGHFSYTFDTDQLSFEETVLAVADAVFCRAYRQNGVIRLALEAPQAQPVALINHRNKNPDFEEVITRTFANDSDFDGVELSYADPDTESQETIILPLDGNYTKLKRIEVSGIRSYAQAWFRANREFLRLFYERRTVEAETTLDARALIPNAKVDLVDNTLFETYDGEVVDQGGLELTLSNPVAFTPGQAHSIVLARRDGSVESIAVTPGSAPDRVVLAAPPAEGIVIQPDPDIGERTRFSFAADVIRGAEQWVVREIALGDNFARITCGNYAPEIFAADLAPVPPKEDVIY